MAKVEIDVVHDLVVDGREIRYNIIGDGEYRDELVKRVDFYGLREFVHFRGFLSAAQIREYLRESDFHVLLSYPETFGRSYFEAAAQGVIPIGIKGTGAHGHLSSEHGFFLDHEKDLRVELRSLLRNINPSELMIKREKLRDKMNDFEQSRVLACYFDLICDASMVSTR